MTLYEEFSCKDKFELYEKIQRLYIVFKCKRDIVYN